MIFCEFVNNGFVNENKNENKYKIEFELELENNDCDFYDCCDLCNGPLCPAPIPTFNFIISRAGLRERLVLEYLFGVICNGIVFDCNVNNEIMVRNVFIFIFIFVCAL